MTSPVLRISGPSTISTPDKFAKRKHAFFDRNVFRDRFFGEAQVGQSCAGHDFGGDVGDRDARGFGDKRNGAAGARIDFQNVNIVRCRLLV